MAERSKTTGALLALMACAAFAQADQPPSSAKPELTGRWQLNKTASEDARAKLQASGPGERAGSGPPGGGRRGPGGGSPGGRPGGAGRQPGAHPGGRMGTPGGPGGPGAEMHEFFEPAQTLTITGNDAELTFDDGEGGLTRLHVDGKSYKREGGSLETKAVWKEQALVVESKSERGPKLVSTYRLLPQGKQLEVIARLEGRREPIVVRRVYDRAPAETAPTP